MHDGVWMTILGIVGLMTIAGLVLPVTRRLGFPYTVFLASLGILLGLIAGGVDDGGAHADPAAATDTAFGVGAIIGDLFHALDTFTLSSDVILFLFLPALVFESSLSIDLRKLLADIGPILFLAVVGLLVSAFLTAGAISTVAAMPFVVCLLVGAILSATDPVAVVAIFKDLGAPKRLAVLVEGESLFNDATAIVLFHIVLAMIIGQSNADLGSGALEFAIVFFGGIAVGLAMTALFSMALARAGGIALVEVTLTISLAYLSFLVAEHYLHVSGVMAVVTSALMLGSYGRTSMTATGWHLLAETWETIGFWANSLIFLLVGILVPQIVSRMTWGLVGVIVVTVLAAFAARAVLTHGLLPLMIRWRVSAPVSLGFRTVMWWGGLRGAVSLALALAVAEDAAIPEDIRTFVVTVVCGFVLFTLFVNATTVGAVMRMFGLDQLDPTDQAIRDRAIRHELGQIAGDLPAFAEAQNIPEDVAASVADGYAGRASVAGAGDAPLPDEAWVRIGLAAQLGQERRAYLQHYAAGHISSPIARELVRQTEDLIDQMKTGGRATYDAGIARALGFDWRIRWAREVHRRLGIARPLAALLARRLERLRTRHAVAREMLYGGHGVRRADGRRRARAPVARRARGAGRPYPGRARCDPGAVSRIRPGARAAVSRALRHPAGARELRPHAS